MDRQTDTSMPEYYGTTLLLQPFYGSLDFVRHYPGKPVAEKPKPIGISWSKRQ